MCLKIAGTDSGESGGSWEKELGREDGFDTAVEMYGKVQRPRFKRRTWGTLRAVSICEEAEVSSFDQREFSRFRLNRSGPRAP